MALECSRCGAPRTTSAPACPFCKALHDGAAPPGAPADRPAAPPGVIEALDAGDMISAIRLYRVATKASLRDAKEAVEGLSRARRPT